MNIFLFFEHLCFDKLCKDLDEKFKDQINKEDISLIKNKIKGFKLRDDLSKALRRYISRYLVGIEKETGLENNNLFLELEINSDLWGIEFGNMNEIKEFLDDKCKDIVITVSKSFEFYNLIGDKDKQSIEELININENNNNLIGDKDKQSIEELINIKENNNSENEDSIDYNDDDDENLSFERRLSINKYQLYNNNIYK